MIRPTLYAALIVGLTILTLRLIDDQTGRMIAAVLITGELP